MQKYLTEDSLSQYLDLIYPNMSFFKDRKVINSGLNCRADYCNYDNKIIIEFDGYRHYNTSKVILTDRLKDKVYSEMGFTIIRIPYFVQMSSQIIKLLFGKNIDIEQTYNHGFIDSKALTPSDFCYLGIKRFEENLQYFDCIKAEIVDSLKSQIKCCGDKRLIIPEILDYII